MACVVLEGLTPHVQPVPGFLDGVRTLCDEFGALMVLDEMINGFRVATAGAQEIYSVTPDLTTFGKALGNGFAVSALVGRREYMEYGGYDHGRERVFLLSTTHGAETHALAAAMAVVDTYVTSPSSSDSGSSADGSRKGSAGGRRRRGRRARPVRGHPANLVFATLDAEGRPSQPFRTLFLQELLDRASSRPPSS